MREYTFHHILVTFRQVVDIDLTTQIFVFYKLRRHDYVTMGEFYKYFRGLVDGNTTISHTLSKR